MNVYRHINMRDGKLYFSCHSRSVDGHLCRDHIIGNVIQVDILIMAAAYSFYFSMLLFPSWCDLRNWSRGRCCIGICPLYRERKRDTKAPRLTEWIWQSLITTTILQLSSFAKSTAFTNDSRIACHFDDYNMVKIFFILNQSITRTLFSLSCWYQIPASRNCS